MAESIFTVLETRKTETTVPFMGKVKDENGKLKTVSVPHTIPDELFPTDEEFESPEKLIAWAKETDCMFEMLQKGVGKALIEVRAKFKAPKKGKDGEPDEWTPEQGQKQVDSMKWTPVKRPNQSINTDTIKAAAGLKATLDAHQNLIDNLGLTLDQITLSLNKQYDDNEAIVSTILAELNF